MSQKTAHHVIQVFVLFGLQSVIRAARYGSVKGDPQSNQITKILVIRLLRVVRENKRPWKGKPHAAMENGTRC